MDTGQEVGSKRTDAGQEEYRTGGMQEREIQERRDAERESQDLKDTGKDGSGQ